MKSLLLATAVVLAPVAAFASGDAIGNMATTSMGAPYASPNYSAPRSAIVPGLPAQEREAQAMNRGHQRQLQAEAGEVNLAPHGSAPAV
jgi:hypothetical protein